MGEAKKIRLEPIKSAVASDFVRRHHYSGRVVQNSQLHFGVFSGRLLGGVIQFGSPMDRGKVLGLVSGTSWYGMMELNRLVFTDLLPRNSESRSLGVCFRIMRREYPHIEWVLSFADATQCGDGTIYRATGFVLTDIKKNNRILIGPERAPDTIPRYLQDAYNGFIESRGRIFHYLTVESAKTPAAGGRKGRQGAAGALGRFAAAYYRFNKGGTGGRAFKAIGCRPLEGFQIRYIYFLNPKARERLTVPELPYSKIEKLGAKMYLGKRGG